MTWYIRITKTIDDDRDNEVHVQVAVTEAMVANAKIAILQEVFFHALTQLEAEVQRKKNGLPH